MRDWSRAKNSTIADQCDRLTLARYADIARMAEQPAAKRETVAEYLARGGKITVIKSRTPRI